MRYFKKLSLLAILGVFLFGETPTVQAQAVSTCPRSLGEQFLDINNVRARILNTGGLFYRGEPHVYEIPKGSGSNAIFASGIWLAGQVGGQLRAAAARYGNNEYWAGPLDDAGNPPVDCVVYDRVYKVSRENVADFEATGSAIPDLADWPTGLGAPTVDADGNKVNLLDQPFASRVGRTIDLGAGERPGILGDQTIWWIMNDRGNIHNSTDAPPIGIEVQVSAFAFNTAGALGDATFYKYNLFYKGDVPLTESYMGIFSDPDLGDFDDDWVGSDTSLGVGFVYNSDNEDGGGEGYGTPPPAVGYDFFQGPIVPAPGDTAYVSGVAVPDFKNLEMTSFVFYNNGGGVTEDPTTGPHYYGYMKAEWKDGKRITFGGNGRDFSEDPTNFMFPGDPATKQFWSEVNSDGQGTSIEPGDRRFVLSTGPFTINPGDQQEIIFGLAFGKGDDNLDSVNAMRDADAVAQAAFDVNFQLAQPPDAPDVTVTELNNQIILEWSNRAGRSNNYLESYSAEDPFAPFDNPNYDFEGYKVYQFAEIADQIGKVIATYDVVNDVTEVIDGAPFKPTSIVASGTDSGVQTWHSIPSLINFQTYYFGVQAYAYNEPSFPKIYPSPIQRVEVIPQPSEFNISDDARDAAISFAEADFVADLVGVGQGVVTADIVNPGAIIEGAEYQVLFYTIEKTTGKRSSVASVTVDPNEKDPVVRVVELGRKGAEEVITYDITRRDDSGITVLFDGSVTGDRAPQRVNVVVLDGLQFSVTGPEPGFAKIEIVANASGVLDPPDMGTYGWGGMPHPGDLPDRPTTGYAQSTSNWRVGIVAQGGGSSPSSMIGRWTRGAGVDDEIGSFDYEMRWTTAGDGDLCWDPWDGVDVFDCGVELWNVGVGTPDDASDDYRMVPIVCVTCGGADHDATGVPLDVIEFGGDSAVSGADNDPQTDAFYWYEPSDDGVAPNRTPGESGYEAFFFGAGDIGAEVFGRMTVMVHNLGSAPPYDIQRPEVGTTFRITTLNPSQPGDSFTFTTTGFGISEMSLAEKKDDLDLIGIVPNPYKGSSAYERSQLIDEVRFTGMPVEETVISVFALNGSLIKTILKPEGVRNQSWNLTTDNSLPIASGMYLIHVDVKGVGSKVIKFAAIKKRIQLNTF